MQMIPLAAIPSQSFQIVLDGQDCTLKVYQRERRMFLDLAVDNEVVRRGAVCVDRAEILQSPSPDFTGGLFFADSEGSRPPEWTGLGTRWNLYFVPEDEMEGLR